MNEYLECGQKLQGFINTTNEYTIKELIGSGGTGNVYLAQGGNGKLYALKELYPKELRAELKRNSETNLLVLSTTSNEEKTKNVYAWYKENLVEEAKFCQEAVKSRCLNNNDPYFLNCLGILEMDDLNTYAIYETYEGRTLSQCISEFWQNPAKDYEKHLTKMLIIMAIASTKLQYVHNMDILHLDLSPSNLYLSDYGYGEINNVEGEIPCLLDFGSAFKIDSDVEKHRFSASEGFTAPELYNVLNGVENKITTIADVYSLVAIVYYALTGEIFDDNLGLFKDELLEKFNKYPKTVQKSLMSLFEKNLYSEARHQSAKELGLALLEIRGKLTNGNEDIQEIVSAIKSIDKKLEKVSLNTEVIKETTEKTKGITKNNNKILKILLCAVSALFVFFTVGVFSFFLDFEAPQIIVTNLKPTENGSYEVYNGYEQFVLKATDNDGITYFALDENDIQFDGFSCPKNLRAMPDGTYLLELFCVEKLSDNPRIIINSGCVSDFKKNENEQIIINLDIKSLDEVRDSTIPTVTITKPKSEDNNKYVKIGSNVSFKIYFDDETQIKNIYLNDETKTDFIHAVGFEYDYMKLEQINSVEFQVTLEGVTGSKGEHTIYISPALAEDENGNFTQGIKSGKFYIYENETDKDIARPVCTIFAAEYKEGGVVEYKFCCADNETSSIEMLNLSEDMITTNRFEADVEIVYMKNSGCRIIRFSNIVETTPQELKYFTIDSGAAIDNYGNKTPPKDSPPFKMSELKY